MYIVLPWYGGTVLIPDHAISYVRAWRTSEGAIEYAKLEIWLKGDDEPFVIRNSVEAVQRAFTQIVGHWEEPGYSVQIWFSDAGPDKLAIESPAPEALATGD